MKLIRSIATCLCLSMIVCLPSSCKQSGSADTSAENAAAGGKTFIAAPMLEVAEFQKGMQRNRSVLVDVRMPQEYEQGHIEGSTNINFFDPNFKNQLLALDKDKKYYLYCKNDTRSEKAGEFLLQNDFKDVFVLKGGFDAWKSTDIKN